jgi:hypothetical protein
MKKSLLVALTAMFLVSLVGVALAGPPVALTNGEMKASLLVWPKIAVSYDVNRNVIEDTIVTIFNDGPGPVYMHCYWMDEYQETDDFEFEITRFQTVWFKAGDGGGMEGSRAVSVSPFQGELGELKCFVVNDDDAPTTRNNFTGTATIFDFVAGTAMGYNAYGFRRSGVDGTPGVLHLDGAEYDHCPAYMFGTFMLDGASFYDGKKKVEALPTELTLVPCDQDLRQDRLPIYTKVNFTVWDEDEIAATGAYLCFKCWVDAVLTDPPKVSGGDKFARKGFHQFTQTVIGGVYATVKITPVSGSAAVCNFPVTSPARPVIGLLLGSTLIANGGGSGKNGSYKVSTGSLLQSPSTAWGGPAPTILYDAAGAGANPERNVR